MIIPSKFNGFHDGVRRCFGGGGGGGGAGGDGGTGDAASATGEGAVGPGAAGTGNGTGGGVGGGDSGGGGGNTVYTPTYVTNTGNTGANTNFSNVGNTSVYSGPGVSTPQGMAALGAAKGTPWGQSGAYYNDLLNQGFTSNQIRTSASDMYGAPSEANWGAMVQNAAMNSPTRRPMAGSDQFFQPVYQSPYMNYARPSTQFDVSTYGTQAMNSPAFNSGMSRGNINNSIENFYATNPMGRNADVSNTLNFMRDSGVNREDFQSWAGKNNYSPQMSMPQTQQPFNPYTNSSGYGGQSSFMPQMQNPFMQPQQNYYTPQQSMSPYMSQQQYSQPSMSYAPMTNPYMQQASPYNYQPSYGGYGGDFGGGVNMYTPVTQQPTQPVAPRSSGPTTPIVGRSAGFRGTPNVMRRAEGGIIDLMDKK
jgi:hypothetical protein